jgi:hypothetical protein
MVPSSAFIFWAWTAVTVPSDSGRSCPALRLANISGRGAWFALKLPTGNEHSDRRSGKDSEAGSLALHHTRSNSPYKVLSMENRKL